MPDDNTTPPSDDDDKPKPPPPSHPPHTNGKRKAPPPRVGVVVTLPTKRELHADHRAQLMASGLTAETIDRAKLYTEYHRDRLAALMQRRTYPLGCGAAIVFPFYLPGAAPDAEPHAYRIRPTHARRDRSGKPIKYDQADSIGVLVYYAPRALAGGWLADPSRVIYWTEGEKKCLALDQIGLACVGLTGVWNWLDAEQRRATNEQRLHPHIREHVTVAGRAHVIVFDADSRSNDQVMRAAQTLAGVLLAAGAAAVRFACPPTAELKGVDDYYNVHGELGVRALLDAATEIEPIDPRQPLQHVRRISALRDAPLSEALRMPDGYEIQKDGSLWRKATDDKHGDARIAPSAIFLTRHLADHYSAERRVELSYQCDGTWSVLCVPRKAIADSRTLVDELGARGAPVTSNSASKLVDWLESFGDVNAEVIPKIACVASSGWHTINRADVFSTDAPRALEASVMETIALDTSGDRAKIFAALKPRGALDAHLAALRLAWNADPVCAAMICAAFATTLLKPLAAPNFAIHLPGESSRGKTSMLKIAASVFGDPNSPHWVASWNVTATGAELRAATLCDLPQCYDEIGGGDPQAIERMVYGLINGGGRTRAQRDLTMRETQSWRTIVLSTGEREITDEQTSTGAQVRCVQLPVRGFGDLTAAQIDALRDECATNAGSAGRAWIVDVLLACDDWAPMRDALARTIKALRGDASDPLQSRIAAYFALLVVTETMLAAELELGRIDGGTMRALFANLAGREAVESVADRARDLVQDWVLSQPDAFPELEIGASGTPTEPHVGRGTQHVHGYRTGADVLVLRSSFDTFCRTHRLAPKTVVREWLARSWTEVDADKRLCKRVQIGRTRPRVVVLRDVFSPVVPDASQT